jgi:hypothetical protein
MKKIILSFIFIIFNYGLLFAITQGQGLSEYFNNNVGIGTTNAAQKLHVVGNNYITGSIAISTNTYSKVLNVGGTSWLNGNVSISTTTSSQTLQVNGRIAMYTWTADGDAAVYKNSTNNCFGLQTSDYRLKKDTEVVTGILDDFTSIPVICYRDLYQTEEQTKKYGVFAQDVMAKFPYATYTISNPNNPDDTDVYYSVHYDKLSALDLEAIKELYDKIKSLEARIEALENK